LPTTFSFNKSSNNFQTGFNIPMADGEVRDIKWIKTAGGKKIMIVARNNNALQFFKQAE
jgi:enediyne biosynthesis protein E4